MKGVSRQKTFLDFSDFLDKISINKVQHYALIII